MEYNDMLRFLQGMLTGPNWKYLLGQQQLAQSGSEFEKQLAQQGTQFGQTLAEQTAARLAQERLAQEQQRQAEEAQRYAEATQTYQSSPAYMNILRSLQPSAVQSEMGGAFLKDWIARMFPNQQSFSLLTGRASPLNLAPGRTGSGSGLLSFLG